MLFSLLPGSRPDRYTCIWVWLMMVWTITYPSLKGYFIGLDLYFTCFIFSLCMGKLRLFLNFAIKVCGVQNVSIPDLPTSFGVGFRRELRKGLLNYFNDRPSIYKAGGKWKYGRSVQYAPGWTNDFIVWVLLFLICKLLDVEYRWGVHIVANIRFAFVLCHDEMTQLVDYYRLVMG